MVLKQFANCFTLRQDWHRAAGQVGERVFGGNAEMTIGLRPDVVGGQGPFVRAVTKLVGAANHLAGAQPAARKQRGIDARPMVATGLGNFRVGTLLLADAWRVTKFPGDDEQDIPVHSTVVKVGD